MASPQLGNWRSGSLVAVAKHSGHGEDANRIWAEPQLCNPLRRRGLHNWGSAQIRLASSPCPECFATATREPDRQLPSCGEAMNHQYRWPACPEEEVAEAPYSQPACSVQ